MVSYEEAMCFAKKTSNPKRERMDVVKKRVRRKYDYEQVKWLRYEGYSNSYIADVINAPSHTVVSYLAMKIGLPKYVKTRRRGKRTQVKRDAVTGEPI